MPTLNFIAIGLAALVPLFVGWIWYNPKVLGNAIAVENDYKEGETRTHHPMVYIMCVVGSFLISMLLAGILSTHAIEDKNALHGLFHGCAAAVFMGIPTFMIIALFEFKSVKYILIHAGYWFFSMGIMGGIIGFFG